MEPNIPKAEWAPGPWHDEPDRLEWQAPCGLPALIVRSKVTGALCGYAGVPPGHPLYGLDKDDPALDGIRCHGGITYAGGCHGDICHTAAPGETDKVWWFGYDTAHFGDRMPQIEARLLRLVGTFTPLEHEGDMYWDIDYVKQETNELARQLAEF